MSTWTDNTSNLERAYIHQSLLNFRRIALHLLWAGLIITQIFSLDYAAFFIEYHSHLETILLTSLTLPCYLHLSIHADESTAEDSMRFPVNLHLDHPSLEQISIKRVKSVEKNCIFPSIGLIFIRGQLFEKDHSRYSDPDGDENSGLFECVQTIRQQEETTVPQQAWSNSRKHSISRDG